MHVLPNSAPSGILSKAENLVSSGFQDGATKLLFFLNFLREGNKIQLGVWWRSEGGVGVRPNWEFSQNLLAFLVTPPLT